MVNKKNELYDTDNIYYPMHYLLSHRLYVSCLVLGTIKKLLQIWNKGPLKTRLSVSHKEKLTESALYDNFMLLCVAIGRQTLLYVIIYSPIDTWI